MKGQINTRNKLTECMIECQTCWWNFTQKSRLSFDFWLCYGHFLSEFNLKKFTLFYGFKQVSSNHPCYYISSPLQLDAKEKCAFSDDSLDRLLQIFFGKLTFISWFLLLGRANGPEVTKLFATFPCSKWYDKALNCSYISLFFLLCPNIQSQSKNIHNSKTCGFLELENLDTHSDAHNELLTQKFL